jgi:hypothetical protein
MDGYWGSFTLLYGGWSVKVTTSLHLMRSEAIPHLIYALMAFTGAFFFYFLHPSFVSNGSTCEGGQWRKKYNRELEDLYNEPNIK